jgi:A/G-specific adenine glycosylase
MDLASPSHRRFVRHALLRWFERYRRDLPWRHDRDPYRIWVSEIMLQQTQVATVIPYFARFVAAFPNIRALAHADEQEVLRLWEGLGYYRRARNLHRAARLLTAEHDACIPDNAEALSALPGIGRYMVGAILSQAFDQRLPILEANSQRVLSRLIGLRDDPRRGIGRARLWELATTLLPAKRVGEFNQAVMELGALVCTPRSPSCEMCPLATACEARRLGIEKEVPLREQPPVNMDILEVAVVVRRSGRVLLVQRPDHVRWAALWEFPHDVVSNGKSRETAVEKLLTKLTGIEADVRAELLTVRHGVTHHRITLVCFEGDYKAGRFRSSFYRKARWVRPAELPAFPLSAPQRRVAKYLSRPVHQQRMF